MSPVVVGVMFGGRRWGADFYLVHLLASWRNAEFQCAKQSVPWHLLLKPLGEVLDVYFIVTCCANFGENLLLVYAVCSFKINKNKKRNAYLLQTSFSPCSLLFV